MSCGDVCTLMEAENASDRSKTTGPFWGFFGYPEGSLFGLNCWVFLQPRKWRSLGAQRLLKQIKKPGLPVLCRCSREFLVPKNRKKNSIKLPSLSQETLMEGPLTLFSSWAQKEMIGIWAQMMFESDGSQGPLSWFFCGSARPRLAIPEAPGCQGLSCTELLGWWEGPDTVRFFVPHCASWFLLEDA